MHIEISPATGETTIKMPPEEAAELNAFVGWAEAYPVTGIADGPYRGFVERIGKALQEAEERVGA